MGDLCMLGDSAASGPPDQLGPAALQADGSLEPGDRPGLQAQARSSGDGLVPIHDVEAYTSMQLLIRSQVAGSL